uniref:Secreted protein n=1 Tax=Anguilla anguilla TaxID=7936 RepID=A0A0E9X8L1_ANGAN
MIYSRYNSFFFPIFVIFVCLSVCVSIGATEKTVLTCSRRGHAPATGSVYGNGPVFSCFYSTLAFRVVPRESRSLNVSYLVSTNWDVFIT